ncbi:MAG: ABC transporter permease subunit [Lachnospiraceae bacterium]|nr:ABC transporter permease subunit [Lachnospiraceae bacterium]
MKKTGQRKKQTEIKIIFLAVAVLFVWFLAAPVIMLLLKSFQNNQGAFWVHYIDMFAKKGFWKAVENSFLAAGCSSILTTLLAFLLAYTVHYTNLPRFVKKLIRAGAVLPMLLPTITYGFAIIYSFGKQGLITRLFGHQFFDIYGFGGLLLGYVVYTLPVSFLLLHNTMGYIDKKFMVVSRIMGDKGIKTFAVTILRPLLGTLAASLVQCFFLAFTDFGIPASVGGQYEVVASVLYDEMLGSLPNFNNGAVVAVIMLVPSVVSIALLHYLERYNVRYNKISVVENWKNKTRDSVCAVFSMAVMVMIAILFAVVFIVPFVSGWPYDMTFTMEHVTSVLADPVLSGVYKNSLLVSLLTALVGSFVAYGAALVTARSRISKQCKSIVEGIALVTNTIPGMVIGIAFLLMFSGTSLQNTFLLIILCNVVHYFSTPYLMMKNSLEKMNASWETTAMLMGDNWLKTIFRVVTPNALPTILEVFSYYFVNAMVTVSAVVFIAGARTMVITTKIKELQHFAKFNEIFVLSLGILFTNIVAKGIFQAIANYKRKDKKQKKDKSMKEKRQMKAKRTIAACLAGVLTLSMAGTFTACSNESNKASEQVIIYSNADDEAITAMKNALDQNGYEGQYLFQSFGTSELGGKLLAEGTNIEADMVTMSSFYLDSAQEQNKMFETLTFDAPTLTEVPDFYRPITSQEGAIIVNTEEMKTAGLPMPASIKDLADPVYEGQISVTDIKSSSTAWLLIQALVSEYGEDGAKEVLTGIYKNAGPHIEDSGSGPIKKVRAGEVAIGFGLRHQAVADKAEGLPIDFVDPSEGNFSLTESVAVIDKGDKTNPTAMKMAECIIKNGRQELQQTYPNPIYEGETVDTANESAYPKVFSEPLTAALLERHQELSESCK